MSNPWFIGQYLHSIDAKNRVFIPPAFRDKLVVEKAKAFIMTTGLDGCLWLFLPSQWESLLSGKLAAISLPDKELERAFKRKFFAEASETAVDPQGRLLVPALHKAYAGLRKNVFVQGANTRIELWDEARWKQYSKQRIQPSLKKFGKVLEI